MQQTQNCLRTANISRNLVSYIVLSVNIPNNLDLVLKIWSHCGPLETVSGPNVNMEMEDIIQVGLKLGPSLCEHSSQFRPGPI